MEWNGPEKNIIKECTKYFPKAKKGEWGYWATAPYCSVNNTDIGNNFPVCSIVGGNVIGWTNLQMVPVDLDREVC